MGAARAARRLYAATDWNSLFRFGLPMAFHPLKVINALIDFENFCSLSVLRSQKTPSA